MYSASDLKKGLKILWDNIPFDVTDFQFVKPGKGSAMYKCRLRNMLTGASQDRTFREVDRFEVPNLEDRELEFSYIDGDKYVFSDAKSFEEYPIQADVLGDQKFFLNEHMTVDILFFNDKAVEVSLPSFVEKEIVETEPGFKGNTATNTYKAAKIDTGYTIQVPLFINQGDVVRIDTRTAAYGDRVSVAKR